MCYIYKHSIGLVCIQKITKLAETYAANISDRTPKPAARKKGAPGLPRVTLHA